MYLNDVWISDAEIEWIAVSGPALQLRVTWPWEDLPLLLDLPTQFTLCWDHIYEDDPHAGLPVELVEWNALRVAAPLLSVTLQMTRVESQERSAGPLDSEWPYEVPSHRMPMTSALAVAAKEGRYRRNIPRRSPPAPTGVPNPTIWARYPSHGRRGTPPDASRFCTYRA